jgi:hypothetical protein
LFIHGHESHLSTCVDTQSPKYLEMAQGHISLSVMDVDLANNPNWQVSRHPSPSVRTTYVRKTKKKEKQEGI